MHEQASLVLRSRRLQLRRATDADLSALLALLKTPEVSEWWKPASADSLSADLNDEAGAVFCIEIDGVIAGLIQYWEERDPGYRHAAIDIALGAPWQGRGYGSEAVHRLARHLFEERDHHRLTIDPAAHNARAIACYRKVGFRAVGVMRRYELGVDGTWHDGLLMDMLRGELPPAV